MIAHAPSIRRLAYLNSEYPSLSHTFIEREIRQVRRHGVEVTTFSIRSCPAETQSGSLHAREAERTISLLDSPLRLLGRAAATVARCPIGSIRALVMSQRLAVAGLGSRLRHLAYVIEAARLVWELRTRGIEHVHVHMANNGAMVAKLACELDRTLSYSLSIHGSAEFFRVDSMLLAEKVSSAVFVRCISSFCRAQVMAWVNEDQWPHCHIVHCGIDPEEFAIHRRNDASELRLIAVGRLCTIKGFQLLLQACSDLENRGIAWSLNLVGDGPLRQRLHDLAVKLGIARKVRFSGAVAPEQMPRHYRQADVLVISSFMEGVPVVLMEAMAAGLPAVATRVGGMQELLEHGVSGTLVDPASVQQLSNALAQAAENRQRIIQQGAAGRQQVCRAFNIRHVAEEMVRLFERYGVIDKVGHEHAAQLRRLPLEASHDGQRAAEAPVGR